MGEAWRQPWLCHSVYEASSKLCHLCEPCFPICQLEIETVPPSQVAAGVHEVGVQGAYLARLSIVNPTARGAGAPVTPPQTSVFFRPSAGSEAALSVQERKKRQITGSSSEQPSHHVSADDYISATGRKRGGGRARTAPRPALSPE